MISEDMKTIVHPERSTDMRHRQTKKRNALSDAFMPYRSRADLMLLELVRQVDTTQGGQFDQALLGKMFQELIGFLFLMRCSHLPRFWWKNQGEAGEVIFGPRNTSRRRLPAGASRRPPRVRVYQVEPAVAGHEPPRRGAWRTAIRLVPGAGRSTRLPSPNKAVLSASGR